MIRSRVRGVWAGALFVLLIVAGGCAGSNDDTFLDPTKSDVSGTWQYLVTNAHLAIFESCSGDAAVLEGRSFAEGLSLAPICTLPGSFQVVQESDLFVVTPQNVTCSDGSTAVVSGQGLFSGAAVAGQWDSASDQGVAAIQLFSGSTAGNTIAVLESSRTFSGSFQGSCGISPALNATVSF